MKLKASLHVHTAEDPSDGSLIDYDARCLIDLATKNNFKILAITCHNYFAWTKELADYAKQKNILLLKGIELELREGRRRPHVVVLNCQKDIVKIKTLNQLRRYKQKHPQIFILGAHPNSDSFFSLGLVSLKKNLDIFDGIEHTWFYSKYFNTNRPVEKLAEENNKPIIATADLHDKKYLNGDYTIIESKQLTQSSVVEALKAGQVKNFSSPKDFWSMFSFLLKFLVFKSCLCYHYNRKKRL